MPATTPPALTLADRIGLLRASAPELADVVDDVLIPRIATTPSAVAARAQAALGERLANLDRYVRVYAETYGTTLDLGRIADADDLTDVLRRLAAGDPLDEARP